MLRIFSSLAQLDTKQLMAVYLEGNQCNGSEFYPDLNECDQLIRAEEDFLSYLREDFFCNNDSIYAVWSIEGRYVTALRLEPYRDGLLLEALETAPNDRGKGYAYRLISALQERLRTSGWKYIYSHVHKRNAISLHVHKKTGFKIVSDTAVYIDGTVTQNSYTLRFDFK